MSVPNDRYCHDLQFVYSWWFSIFKISMSNLSVNTTGPVTPESVTVQCSGAAQQSPTILSQWGSHQRTYWAQTRVWAKKNILNVPHKVNIHFIIFALFQNKNENNALQNSFPFFLCPLASLMHYVWLWMSNLPRA